MAMKSIGRCDVVILLLDGTSPVTDQDQKIASLVFDSGKYCAIVVNKWDLAGQERPKESAFRAEVQEKLGFLSFSPIRFVSAKTGLNVDELLPLVDRLAEEKSRTIPTADLNRVLEKATETNPPPLVRGKPFKIYYATQVSAAPPTFLLFVNQPKSLPAFYRRYLANRFREQFGLTGAPVRIVLKGKEKKKAER
jgi:GTP-binding protein